MSSAGTPEINDDLLSRFVPINGIAPRHLKQLASQSEIVTVEDGQTINLEGPRSRHTFYLVDGEVQILSGNRVTDTIFARTEKARFSLSHMRDEKHTLKAGSHVKLLRIERAKVSAMLVWDQAEDDDQESLESSLLSSEIISRVPPANVQKISKVMEIVKHKTGDVIIRQGDPGDYYYFVRKGRCLVSWQKSDDSPPIEIAELREGDTFGEEALIANAKRNATVSMLTDGVLLRLTKDKFIELIHDPLVHVVDHAGALKLVKTGAKWLDVRLPEEHSQNGIKGSINIPLASLRRRMKDLDDKPTYVVYCNSGQRSAAATFLLSERGFKAYVLEGGLISIAEAAAARKSGKAAPEDIDPALLHAELAKVNAELEDAIKHKAETEVARRGASEDTLSRSKSDQEKLQLSKSWLEDASRRASNEFERAKRQKREIETKLMEAEAYAAGERKKAEALVARLREEAENRLRAEDERLRQEYSDAAQKIERMRQAKEKAEARFAKERERLETELAKAQQEIASQASKIQEELKKAQAAAEKRASQIRESQSREEQRLRDEMEGRLRAERRRLEAEFAATVAAQEKAKSDLARAEAARKLAEEDSQRIAEELKAAREKRRAAEEALVKKEKQRLEREAREARSKLEAAEKAKRQLQSAKREYDRTMASIRNEEKSLRRAKGESDAERALRAELEAHQKKMEAAEAQIDAAMRAKETADQAKAAAEQKVVQQQAVEEEIRVQLYEEMEQWLNEEREHSEEELSRTQELTRQQIMREKRKQEEKKRREAANAQLLSEVGAQVNHEAGSDQTLAQQASAEKRASMARSAYEEASAGKAKARSALEAARARMKSLFQKKDER